MDTRGAKKIKPMTQSWLPVDRDCKRIIAEYLSVLDLSEFSKAEDKILAKEFRYVLERQTLKPFYQYVIQDKSLDGFDILSKIIGAQSVDCKQVSVRNASLSRLTKQMGYEAVCKVLYDCYTKKYNMVDEIAQALWRVESINSLSSKPFSSQDNNTKLLGVKIRALILFNVRNTRDLFAKALTSHSQLDEIIYAHEPDVLESDLSWLDNSETTQKFLSFGAHVNLHRAYQQSKIDFVISMLEDKEAREIHAEKYDQFGRLITHLAIEKNDLDSLAMMIEAYPRFMRLKTQNDLDIVTFTLANEKYELLHFLYTQNSEIDFQFENILLDYMLSYPHSILKIINNVQFLETLLLNFIRRVESEYLFLDSCQDEMKSESPTTLKNLYLKLISAQKAIQNILHVLNNQGRCRLFGVTRDEQLTQKQRELINRILNFSGKESCAPGSQSWIMQRQEIIQDLNVAQYDCLNLSTACVSIDPNIKEEKGLTQTMGTLFNRLRLGSTASKATSEIKPVMTRT
ncbi:MAG: hypothetical protein ACYCQI_11330 [Gammaproteobacteria bacterium]